MPPDIREWLERQAAEHRRSLNGELLICLEEARALREKNARRKQNLEALEQARTMRETGQQENHVG